MVARATAQEPSRAVTPFARAATAPATSPRAASATAPTAFVLKVITVRGSSERFYGRRSHRRELSRAAPGRPGRRPQRLPDLRGCPSPRADRCLNLRSALGVGSAEPERASLADLLEVGAALGGAARVPRREVVRVQHVAARFGSEKAGERGEADEAFLGARLERGPAT